MVMQKVMQKSKREKPAIHNQNPTAFKHVDVG